MSIVTIGTDFDTYLCRVINHAANDASGTDVAETSTVDLIAYLGLFLSPPSLSLSLSLSHDAGLVLMAIISCKGKDI